MRTNYKDYIPSTSQKQYQMTDNPNGTVSLTDVTEYTQEGDKFSAGILNELSQNANWPLTHSKSGTTHALTGLSGVSGTVSCVFTATAGFTAGDTITVDGTAYAIQLSNGEAAEDNLFVSGASVPVVIDTAGKKVNFKAAGASRKFASGSISGIYGGGTSTITLGWEPKYIFCICNQTGRMEPENLTASALAYIDGLVTGFAESDNTPDGAAYIDSSLNVIQTTKTGFTVNNIPVRMWGNENSYFFPYSRETFYWAFD